MKGLDAWGSGLRVFSVSFCVLRDEGLGLRVEGLRLGLSMG